MRKTIEGGIQCVQKLQEGLRLGCSLVFKIQDEHRYQFVVRIEEVGDGEFLTSNVS